MKLKEISVERLFGTYTYVIPLRQDGAVTILHSPNGHGKTTILKLVEAAMEGDFSYLDETPFAALALTFGDGTAVEVRKTQIFASLLDQDLMYLRNIAVHGPASQLNFPFVYEIQEKDGDQRIYPVGLNREAVLSLTRRTRPGSRLAHAAMEEETLPLKERIRQEKLESEIFEAGELAIWLANHQETCNVHLIEANRVFRRMFSGENSVTVECARLYSEELGQMIADVRQKAGELGESLDRTFPARVFRQMLQEDGEPQFDEKTIREELERLEKRRLKLVQVGLLGEDAAKPVQSLEWPLGQKLSQETCHFLSVYIQDNWRKLEVYTALERRLELFLDVINIKNGFSNKQMKICGSKGASFFMDNGMSIPLEKLSSGEKNDFILFYELIFRCNENALILIDEPEISLHIAWQQEFISQLLRICQSNNMQAVVATHSPNIVDEYWDLLVDLDGKEGEEDAQWQD